MLKEKTIIDRANILEAMDCLIRSLNDESAYYVFWISVVPDQADMDDFMDIAEDTELYCEVCKIFRWLIAQYGDSGFYAYEDTVTP